MDFDNKSLKQIMDVRLTDKFIRAYKNQPSLWEYKNYGDENKRAAYKRLEHLLQKQGIETYKDFVAKKVRLLNAYYDRKKPLTNEFIESKSIHSLKNKTRLFNNILLNFNVDEKKILPPKPPPVQTFSKFLMCIKRREILNDKAIYKHREILNDRSIFNQREKENQNQRLEENKKLSYIYKKPPVRNSYLDNVKNESVAFNINYRDILKRCSDGYDALGLLIAAKLRLVDKRNGCQKILSENLINNILVAAMLGKLTHESRIVF